MAKKSIVDIEINDEKFKAFLSSFEKYTAALGETSTQWHQMGQTMGAAILAAHKVMEEASKADAASKKKALDATKKQKDAAEGVAKAWKIASNGAASMANNLERMTLSLVKWSTIWGGALGLIGAGGSLFGLERLAASASTSRRSATGLGISIGEQKAFGVQFGRTVDESKLSELQNSRFDWSRRGAYSAMGISDPEQGSVTELALRMMRRAQQMYRPGMSEQELQASGVGQFFNREELNRLRGTNLATTEKAYRSDVGKLGYGDDVARSWQDFNVKLRESGETIEKTLIVSLGKLEEKGTLSHLSDSLTKLVEALGESPKVAHWLDTLANSFERLAKWLGTNDPSSASSDWKDKSVAQRGFDLLIDPVGSKRASMASDGYEPIPGKAGLFRQIGKDRPEYQNPSGGLSIFGIPLASGSGWRKTSSYHNPGNIMVPGTHHLETYASDAEGIRHVASLLQRYQRKFHLGTIEGFIRKYAPPGENDVEAYIRDVSQRTGFKRGERLDLSNEDTMSKLVSAVTKHEDRKSNFTPTQVKVAIENKTGSNVVVNAKSASVAASGGQ